MIVVKVELHNANTGEISIIGRMDIANISRLGRMSKRGDYKVRLYRRKAMTGGKPKILREGYVHNYPRLSYSIWRLIARALKAVLPEEK